MKKNILIVLATVGLGVAANAGVSFNISLSSPCFTPRVHCAPPPAVVYVPAPVCAAPVVVSRPPCAPPVVYNAPCHSPNVVYFGGRHDGYRSSYGYRGHHGGSSSRGSVSVRW